ncbi:cobalt ABC transporter [Thioclava sp. SK-1]|nr:cobalt ABC transporter [Thioclava sp. SK-1]
MHPEAAHIRLRDLQYAPDGVSVLGPVSLDLTQRRIGVIGRNGSGKSSLSRLLCGLVSPTKGSLRINDVDVFRDRRAALRMVGMLFQNPDHQIIFPTVSEEIAFGLRNMGLTRAQTAQRVTAALAQMGCTTWADRSTGMLSHGQKQLLCLISVLAMEPAVVILDEPMTGLDLLTVRHLQRCLTQARPALIHISHDLEAFDGYDRLLWIDQGRIRMDGAPADVVQAYRDAMEQYVADADLPH